MSQELVVLVVLSSYYTKLFLNSNLKTIDINSSNCLLKILSQAADKQGVAELVEVIRIETNRNVILSKIERSTICEIINLILNVRTAIAELETIEVAICLRHKLRTTDVNLNSLGCRSIVVQPRSVLLLYISINKIIENLRIVCTVSIVVNTGISLIIILKRKSILCNHNSAFLLNVNTSLTH